MNFKSYIETWRYNRKIAQIAHLRMICNNLRYDPQLTNAAKDSAREADIHLIELQSHMKKQVRVD